MISRSCPTSYPQPPASQPAIEGAQPGGRRWITLRRAPNQPPKTQRHEPRRTKNLTQVRGSE